MKVKTRLSSPLGGGEAELEVTKEEGSAIKRFFGAATPGFIKDRVGILNDNTQLARFKNFCRIVNEAEKIRKKCNLKAQVLPLKLGMKFIEDASLEDNETIQTMWANILANADSGKTSAISIYMSTLKNLTSAEAKVLNMFYSFLKGKVKHYGNDPSIYSLSKHFILDELGKAYTDAEVIIDNLIKERLIQYSVKQPYNRLSGLAVATISENVYDPWLAQPKEQSEAEKVIDYLKSAAEATEDRSSFQLTPLGFALLKACNEPDNNQTQK